MTMGGWTLTGVAVSFDGVRTAVGHASGVEVGEDLSAPLA